MENSETPLFCLVFVSKQQDLVAFRVKVNFEKNNDIAFSLIFSPVADRPCTWPFPVEFVFVCWSLIYDIVQKSQVFIFSQENGKYFQQLIETYTYTYIDIYYISWLAWEVLGFPQDKLEEGGLCFYAWAAAPTTWPEISGRRWMDAQIFRDILYRIQKQSLWQQSLKVNV